MKKWQIIAPLALAAGGAVGLVLLKKKQAQPAAKSAKPAAAKKAPANEKTGSYSFVSGYQDAATMEATLRYDADRFAFRVVEEDFLSYSSDSHVAILEGEDFSMQLEYAAYYSGEDFAAHTEAVREKHSSLAPAVYGENKGIRYFEGDNVCFCFPVDAHSYLLVTALKAKGNDDPLSALPDYEDVKDVLGSLRFARVG